MKPIALITGITGQDGSYLAEYLLEKDYEVHGIVPFRESNPYERLEKVKHRITFHSGDLLDFSCLLRIVMHVNPDFIFHLAALTRVGESFDQPSVYLQVNAQGTLNLLEILRQYEQHIRPDRKEGIRFYNACSSEMFGSGQLLSETSPTKPNSPYAISKLYAFHVARMYREAYNLQIWNGIMFNHESPRRGEYFVTQKVVKAAVQQKIDLGAGRTPTPLILGEFTFRNWTHAEEMIPYMVEMLIGEENSLAPADDYILGTNTMWSVRAFVHKVYKTLAIPLVWEGRFPSSRASFEGHLLVAQSYVNYRPLDVKVLSANSSRAREAFKFDPKLNLDDIVADMVAEELCRHVDK